MFKRPDDPTWPKCTACGGSGLDEYESETCLGCGGTGRDPNCCKRCEAAEAQLAALDSRAAGRPVRDIADEIIDGLSAWVHNEKAYLGGWEGARKAIMSALSAERLAAGGREERIREALAQADQLLGQLKRTITKSAAPEIGKGILDAGAQEKLAWCKQIEEARECFVRAALSQPAREETDR